MSYYVGSITFDEAEAEPQSHICGTCKALIRPRWNHDTQNMDDHAQWHMFLEAATQGDRISSLEQKVQAYGERIEKLEELISQLGQFKSHTF